MINKKDYSEAVKNACRYFKRAGIVITPQEEQRIEVADFGLGRLKEIGLQILTYVNTERVCAKELVLTPGQICPEHRHPSVNGKPGKEETFRCRWGTVYLYVEGKPVTEPKGKVPEDKGASFTVWHEIVLEPGQQYTLSPDTLHWFQGGAKGAVVSEFSTRSTDEADIFTDVQIQRSTIITEG